MTSAGFIRNAGASFCGLLLLFAFAGCQTEDVVLEPAGKFQMQIPPGFPPMDFPADNAFTTARWELGKKLFFDPVLSIDGSISCGSCHHPELAFADDQDFSPGAHDRPGTRNAPSLANVGYHPHLLREGSLPSLEMQVLVPIQEHNEFAHNIVDIAAALQQDSIYVQMSQTAYGREPDPYVITRSIATFERSLTSGNSPFDQFRYQSEPTLSAKALAGMELFFSDRTQCASCHGGFNFTNYSFQNNGLDTAYADPGRMRFTNAPEDEALFKVPSLRNVALTPPYMHNARFQSLSEVIEHYNQGGAAHPNKSSLLRPLHLTEAEKLALVSFLESLSDPQFISNPSFFP